MHPNSWSRNRSIQVIVALVAVTLCASACAEPEVGSKENPYLWKPKTKSVAVFKNGLGFFTREGNVTLRDGWCVTRQVPPAAFGTLAIYSHGEDQMVDIVGSGPGEVVEFDGVDAPDTIESRRQRLETSKGIRVELTYAYRGSERQASGKLISVGEEFAVLENNANNFAVPVAGIDKMQVLDLPVRVHVKGARESAPEAATIGMAYLRKGITWIPEYSLEMLDEDTATLTLRGTLVNEAEDLVHSDVHFVVGVPHFVHSDYMAPIAVGQLIRTIGTAVAPPQIASQIMNRAAIVRNLDVANQFSGAGAVTQPVSSDAGELSAAMGNLPKMDSAAGTDYTVYTKKDLTVRRGEKAIVTLFVKKIKYSHIYRWTPPERMKHLLVLHNNTDTAWTTGPVLAVDGHQPLSEDLLRYTPKKGSCEVPVSAAINIAHEKSEEEIERKLKAHSPSHNVYLDLVKLQGSVSLDNFEKKPVQIVTTVLVPGKPLEAEMDGIVKSDPSKLRLTDRQGTVQWRLKLKPRQRMVLSYMYERYVPSR